MLYVFQVDTGTMITFDMNLALNRCTTNNNVVLPDGFKSVSNLKEAIWQTYRIPVDRQVLLVSGGECLDPGSRVCNYAAGTDTNPIFLFNKTNIESSPTTSGQHAPSSGSLENLTDIDSIKDQIKGCLDLPPTYMTVVTRAQLAQQLWEMARDLCRRCEQLVHDQHLQHQGWAAVVANLEDIIVAFRQRAENFENSFMVYLGTKDERLKTLQSFEQDIAMLKEVPILPSLLPPGEATADTLSIVDWIISKDSHELGSLSLSCLKSLEKLDISVIEVLQREKKAVIEKAENTSMKEIKGLEDRFYALDQLLMDAKTVVQDQSVLAQSFLNNQNSASNERDSSIYPDLCQAHQHQLMAMFKKHQHLDEIRRKCAKAKDELIGNLNSRLKWIMYVQHAVSENSSKLTVYKESLRRLRSQLEVVEQIHVAAEIYGEAVMEVVRRKKFSESYGKWATTIAETVDRVHTQEINRRKHFSSRFEGHFLSGLFPGLEDFPILFATKRPEPFDIDLPTIPQEDIDKLKMAYPLLPIEEEQPDFTIDVSSTSRTSEESSRSAIELENLNLKLELEKARFELQTRDDEINRLIKLQEEVKNDLENDMKMKFDMYEGKLKEKEQEINELHDKVRLATEQCTELSETVKQQEIKLEQELSQIKTQHDETVTNMKSEFDKELLETTAKLKEEKENELKILRDQHRGDVEGLRSRYKLMASVDQRSPSDIQDKSFDSLERSQRQDELFTDVSKVTEPLQKNSPNEGMVHQMMRGFRSKFEGTVPQSPDKGGDTSPGVVRARGNAPDEGPSSRVSIEAEEEPVASYVKSVYGLDTSAIDAADMCISDTDPMTKELSDILTPSSNVVSVASTLSKSDRISLRSCNVGENVFIYWNQKLQAYLVYLSNKNVYFLHTDCLKMLDHSLDSPVGGFVAQVTDREFCVAKRANNRYRVPQGFHFYRIRVKVLEIVDISECASK